jgi:lauroyl/myristoyl acyltransferase
MKLADREDLAFVPPVLLALIARWLRIAAARRVLARLLAHLAYRLSRRKRRQIERALDRAFGDSLSSSERATIVLGSLQGVWDELFSLVAGSRARADFDDCEIRGLEHLRSSEAKGRGAILWESRGLGARLMPKRLLWERGFSLHQAQDYNHLGGFSTADATGSVVRAKLLRPFFRRCEAYFLSGFTHLSRDGSMAALRELTHRLGRNEIIAIAGDGTLGHRTLSLPFLGSDAIFATGMVSLARISGADLLPMFCLPRPQGGYLLTIEEPIPVSRSADRQAQIQASLKEYSELLEDYVRRNPGQYRNWHLCRSETRTGNCAVSY